MHNLVKLVNINPRFRIINTSSINVHNVLCHCAQLCVTFFICLLDLCGETEPKMLPNNYILCTIYSYFATFLWALDSDGDGDDDEESGTVTEAIVLKWATMAPSLSGLGESESRTCWDCFWFGLTTAGSVPAASIFIIIKSVERKSIWVT